jgi:hypothetical protein
MQSGDRKCGQLITRASPIHPPLFFLSALLLGALIDDRVLRLVIFHHGHWRWLGLPGLFCGISPGGDLCA